MSSRALRRRQNDQQLLDSLLGPEKTQDSKPKKVNEAPKNQNIFTLMVDANDQDELNEQDEEVECEKEEQPKIKLATKSQKKSKKKNKKGKKTSKSTNSSPGSEGEDELENMIQQYKQHDALKYGIQDFENKNETNSNIKMESFANICKFYDLKTDSGFTYFPASCLECCTGFFSSDFKKLDPHFEFKLLFDDISPESLEDIDSMSSMHVSPQQLKQIQRLKRLVRNWGGKDHRSVPGPGHAARRLQFTKIQEDWLATPRGELSMQSLTSEDFTKWQLWQRPTDWKDIIEEDIKSWRGKVSYYKFEPLDSDINRKAMTEFYLSVIVHPDHESLINLISSRFPYNVPALLQVALITTRQGDRSNTNGLIQRALFVFDRAFKTGLKFDAQRGAIATACEWCKALWSLSPLEDPMGCRYFMDYYLLSNKEYHYLIELSKSPLMTCYRQWFTLGLALGCVLSYLRLGEEQHAREELQRAFTYQARSMALLFVEKLRGDAALTVGLELDGKVSQILETKAYMTRFSLLWQKPEELNFLSRELSRLLEEYQSKMVDIAPEIAQDDASINPFFVEGIPVNLLRFSILSEESSVMASIPSSVWSNHEVYEFDVLPPAPTTKESRESVENIKSFISGQELARSQFDIDQDEALMNQVRQLSLDQFLGENPNVAPE